MFTDGGLQITAYSYSTRFVINADGNETLIDKTQKTNGGQWNFLSEARLNSTWKYFN